VIYTCGKLTQMLQAYVLFKVNANFMLWERLTGVSDMLCRCVLVSLKLGHMEDAVVRLTHVLDLCRWRKVDYKSDKLIVRTMAECHYLSAAKHRSINWPSVQFKDNCYVVDPLGAGDYVSLSVCLSSINRPVLLQFSSEFLVLLGCIKCMSCRLNVTSDRGVCPSVGLSVAEQIKILLGVNTSGGPWNI